VENFYQTTCHDITNRSALYVRPFFKQQALINDIEKFTQKIALLFVEKLQFSSQMRHEYNPDNFVKFCNMKKVY